MNYKVPYIDQTGLYALEDVMLELEKNDIHILIVDIQKQPLYLMRSIDIIPDLVSDDRIFETFDDCTKWILENISLK